MNIITESRTIATVTGKILILQSQAWLAVAMVMLLWLILLTELRWPSLGWGRRIAAFLQEGGEAHRVPEVKQQQQHASSKKAIFTSSLPSQICENTCNIVPPSQKKHSVHLILPLKWKCNDHLIDRWESWQQLGDNICIMTQMPRRTSHRSDSLRPVSLRIRVLFVCGARLYMNPIFNRVNPNLCKSLHLKLMLSVSELKKKFQTKSFGTWKNGTFTGDV